MDYFDYNKEEELWKTVIKNKLNSHFLLPQKSDSPYILLFYLICKSQWFHKSPISTYKTIQYSFVCTVSVILKSYIINHPFFFFMEFKSCRNW